MFIVSFHRNTDKQNVHMRSLGQKRKYYNKAPKCVKCAGPHLISGCDKPLLAQPKCCNCGKNHPANYRGCDIKTYQNLEMTRIIKTTIKSK
jgi:hypothetical protein